jgi:sugar phosphate isomerase/epimerase
LALVDLPVEVTAGSDLFRAQLAFAKGSGIRAVQLNGAAAGMRARELDRSARRDVAALLKRNEMGLSGVDLWIPPEHFVDASRVDRAVAAVVGAIELASDLDRLVGAGAGRVVCLSFPQGVDESVVATIAGKAAAHGARLADFGGSGAVVAGVVGPGFDPAAHLLAGGTLEAAGGAMKLPAGLIAARLTDAGPLGRVAPGSSGGRLDLLAYGVALAAGGYLGHVVLDVRGVADPLNAVRVAREAWERAAGA